MGATGIVLVTTLDDAVWLVPFVARPAATVGRSVVALLHATVFVVTLVCTAIITSVSTVLLEQSIVHRQGNGDDTILTAVGVLTCWSLAAFLWYRSTRKRQLRRKKQQQQQEQQRRQELVDTENHETNLKSEVDPLVGATTTSSSTTLNISDDDDGDDDDDDDGRDHHTDQYTFRPWMVISLTFLGSLDEIAYFPSLLLGGIFSGYELCLGTLLAAMIVLSVVILFLRPCHPIMKWLDKVPLYGVVGVFAMLLTVELVWDLCTST